jgi:hypothetical protein
MITISFQKQSERSGKRNEAGRKTSERERSDERDFRKKERSGSRARSGRSGNGNGAVSRSPKNWLSVKRHFSPLPLRTHALVDMNVQIVFRAETQSRQAKGHMQ